MHHQTHSNIQMFTIFGAYVFERRGEFLSHGRRETQQCCDTGKTPWAGALRKLHISVSGLNAR